MTAEDYLLQYEAKAQRVDKLRAEYETLRDSADCLPSSLSNAGQPRGGVQKFSAEELALALADKSAELRQAEAEAMRVQIEIYFTIQEVRDVSERVGSVLYERYINLRSWDEVSQLLGCSMSSVYRLHRQGLAETVKIL